MASFKQVPITEKCKTMITEMKESLLVEKPTKGQVKAFRNDVYAKGIIRNYAPGVKIEVLDHHDWSGKLIGGYPPSIPHNLNQGFTHKGLLPHDFMGSKGAVVYAGKSDKDLLDYDIAWLLAWHVPFDRIANKVYVECGDINNYQVGKIAYDIIERKLDISSTHSFHMDDKTGARAVVDIYNTEFYTGLPCLFYVDGHS